MNKKNTLFRAGCVALAMGMLLSGCGSNSGANKDNGDGNKDNKTTIRMSWWGNDDRHKATLAAIKKFEEKNPDIKVKAEYAGWDGFQEKMTTQIAGGTNPDLMQINYDWYQAFSPDGNGFYDLNKLKSIIDFSGYSKETLEPGEINEKLNGISCSDNGSVIVLNKTTYDKFGAEIPTDWDGFVEAANKFDEGYYPLIAPQVEFMMINIYLSQKTGKAFLSDDGKIQVSKDDLQDGFDWYQSLIDKKIVPTGKEVLEIAGKSDLSTVKEFIEGKIAGCMTWPAQVSSLESVLEETNQELVVAKFPTIEGAKTSGIIKKPSMLWSISKDTKHPKETAKLLNFLINDPDGIKALGTTRGVPSNENGFKILKDDGKIDGVSEDLFDYVKNTDGITESPFFERAQISEVYQDATEAFTLGEIDSEKAAEQTISGIKETIKTINNK
ncbi:carbohydrate ABC transporter substrate-binding protein [Blautia liquoris]|uniref:Carbohydrate ABC transporter substrate-binding protein n=1 Tax=Blautia liquoris TaxID=2779518 RepID=A0A7M2RGM1_9FIRM|nr:ABC transporter substrate-binding protein [Blautia liquoris]QOV19181.1 carbohydrate ABC transporter substrate-binding protein [Blautia liquoris]